MQCSQCGEKFVFTCPDCGEPVEADVTQCPRCGANLYESEITPADVLAGELACPQCGAAVHREDGVCSDCGATFCPRCLTLTGEGDETCPG
jgi:predicted amidophosphoribosyltransferase